MANWGDGRLPDRFWSKVIPEPNSSCWLWTACLDVYGYGNVGFNGKTRKSHRVSYEALVSAINPSLQLDHLCRVRCCCNPDHLEPVTAKINVLRGEGICAANAAKTHCQRGHALTEANLLSRGRIRPDSARTWRECLTCVRDRCREERRRKRDADKVKP